MHDDKSTTDIKDAARQTNLHNLCIGVTFLSSLTHPALIMNQFHGIHVRTYIRTYARTYIRASDKLFSCQLCVSNLTLLQLKKESKHCIHDTYNSNWWIFIK